MRVSNQMIIGQHQRNLNNTMGRLHRIEMQIATGRAVNRPSDNPLSASRILNYERVMGRNDRFIRNIETTSGFTEQVDTTLAQAAEILREIEGIIQQGLNEPLNQDDLDALAIQMEAAIGTMLQLMNAQHGDTYLFGGDNHSIPPFEQLPNGQVVFHGNSNVTQVGIADGVTINKNIPGTVIIGGTVTPMPDGGYDLEDDLFSTLNNVLEALQNGDHDVLEEMLTQVQGHHSNVTQQRTRNGAVQNRLDSTLMMTENTNENLLASVTLIRDVNIAEASMRHALAEATYFATLQVASNITRPSLMDFIR